MRDSHSPGWSHFANLQKKRLISVKSLKYRRSFSESSKIELSGFGFAPPTA
jgi:hypothetical protein